MLHLILLLTLEFLALIAAFFLLIYINKQELNKWYRHVSKVIVIILHVLIITTFVHGIVHHFQTKHNGGFQHNELFEKHHCSGSHQF